MPGGRECRSCGKLVLSLPGWPNRTTHRVQERVDVLAAEHRGRVVKHALPIVPMHGPAARLGCSREGLAVHDGVGDGLRAVVGDPLLDGRWKLGARADPDARNRHGYRRGQRLEALARAALGGRSHALDERHGISERQRPRSRRVQVAPHCPRPFVVMRVGRQTAIGKGDAPAVEELAAGRDMTSTAALPCSATPTVATRGVRPFPTSSPSGRHDSRRCPAVWHATDRHHCEVAPDRRLATRSRSRGPCRRTDRPVSGSRLTLQLAVVQSPVSRQSRGVAGLAVTAEECRWGSVKPNSSDPIDRSPFALPTRQRPAPILAGTTRTRSLRPATGVAMMPAHRTRRLNPTLTRRGFCGAPISSSGLV